MNEKEETTVQAIAYLVRISQQSLSKLVLLKLLYLADRYHLRKYGRTILNDRYLAMPYGPVASKAKDTIENRLRDEYALQYVRVSMIAYKHKPYEVVSAHGSEPLGWLSPTDTEALDAAWKVSETQRDLVKFTHKFPEWKKHDAAIKAGATNVPMSYLDFFEPCPAFEYCDATPELVEMSKEEYLEQEKILDELHNAA